MTIRRFMQINLGLFLLGLVVAGLWVYVIGGPRYLAGLARVNLGYLGPMFTITAVCVLLRFFRWQFLLRRAGIRLPTRPSLSIFLSSLPGIATPAYAGEVVRSVFIRRKFGVPIRITASVWVLERLLDVAALGVIGALTAERGWMRDMMALLALAAGLVGFAVGRLARHLSIPPAVLTPLAQWPTLVQALIMSLAAWTPAALLVSLAARSLTLWVSPVIGMRVFSTATLLGGLTLMPAGIGTTTSLAIFHLRGIGLTLADAVVIVSLLRLASIGLALAVGAVFLARELKGWRRATEHGRALHFNEIAAQYHEQFPPHIWDYLLDRKTNLLAAALPNPPSAAGIGLDLGCGLGRHCLSMGRLGYRVVGIDTAQGLLQRANAAGVPVANGSALALPFRSASFDFVYAVGIIHHLPGQEAQEMAFREVWRVLKSGGRFIVHETNPHNPLFRFYMGYIFPILKTIDEGTERWIEPHRWKALKGMKFINLQYFTFLPDFLPRFLMRLSLKVERRLEASPLRLYSVHYMIILEKDS